MGGVSIEDEMKGDVYSFAIILWEMMTRKTPWAHRMFFLFFPFLLFSLIFFSLLFGFFFF